MAIEIFSFQIGGLIILLVFDHKSLKYFIIKDFNILSW